MFHSLFTQAGVCFSGATARRFVARAASLGALTALMLGVFSGTAVAQVVRDHRTGSGGTGTAPPTANTNTKPLRVSFAGLHCLQESNDDSWPFPDHDEPYLVVFAADLRGGTANGIVLLSQTFSDVDKGDVVDYGTFQFWSLDGSTGSPIASSEDYIFLVAVMESDDGRNRDALRSKLPSILIPRLQSYKQAGLSRGAMVNTLAADMNLAIEAAFQSVSGNYDDRIGRIYEVLWSPYQLDAARAGQTVDQVPVFTGSGSSYEVTFRLQ